ncbi:MAG: hypothetical protein ACRERV_18300, partial [Methylococcales bacterium]
MKKMIVLCTALVSVMACKSPTAPEKYRYENKKIDFPYTDFQIDRASAEKKAQQELDVYVKDACRQIAYG